MNYIQNIINICETEKNNIILYYKIKYILGKINNNLFLEEFKNYNFINILNINNNNYIYTKNIIYTSEVCDIMLIKWNKNAITKIHDHPENGCIVKILEGNLLEKCYNKNLDITKINNMLINDIGYKISNNILHSIECINDAYSLHVYIPGKYIPNKFN